MSVVAVPYTVLDMTSRERAYVVRTWIEQTTRRETRKIRRAKENDPATAAALEGKRAEREAMIRAFVADHRVVVALGDDNYSVLGWICYGVAPFIVHYVYVPAAVRRCGIARRLADHIGVDTTRPVRHTGTSPMLAAVATAAGLRLQPVTQEPS